jgi:hypothetical protein
VRHRRFRQFRLGDPGFCSIALDFIVAEPATTDLERLLASSRWPAPATGLRFVARQQRFYLFSGQRRRLGLGSPEALREFLRQRFPQVSAAEICAQTFHSDGATFNATGWRRYRWDPQQAAEDSGSSQLVCGGDDAAKAEYSRRPESGCLDRHRASSSEWRSTRQLVASQWSDGRFADCGPLDDSAPDGPSANTGYDMHGHFSALARLLQYCRESDDLSILSAIVSGLDCFVSWIADDERGPVVQRTETPNWDAASQQLAIRVLQEYQQLTGDLTYGILLESLDALARRCPDSPTVER